VEEAALRISLAIAFLLGVCATLLAVLVFRPPQVSFADSSSSAGFVAVAGNAAPGAHDVLWLVDTKSDTPRLTMYESKEGKLALVHTRNIKYDFMYDEFPKGGQQPSVAQVFKDTEQQRKDQAKKPDGEKKNP
jgi:hypothetical protein